MKAENKVTLVCEGPVDRFGNVTLVDPERPAELSIAGFSQEFGKIPLP
jgi:hypothetical protein